MVVDLLDGSLQLCYHTKHFRTDYCLVVGLDQLQNVPGGVDWLVEELFHGTLVVDVDSET